MHVKGDSIDKNSAVMYLYRKSIAIYTYTDGQTICEGLFVSIPVPETLLS